MWPVAFPSTCSRWSAGIKRTAIANRSPTESSDQSGIGSPSGNEKSRSTYARICRISMLFRRIGAETVGPASIFRTSGLAFLIIYVQSRYVRNIYVPKFAAQNDGTAEHHDGNSGELAPRGRCS